MISDDPQNIDCDIHIEVPGNDVLLPYMDEFWNDAFASRGIRKMDLASYPPYSELSRRADRREKSNSSSLQDLIEHGLKPFNTGIAICNALYGGQVAMGERMGDALCRATNEWVAREWLDREPRLRASIIVAAQSPMLAAEEIERRAGDRRFVQILLLAANELTLGRSYYWPIFEAAERNRLPVGIHAGSMYRYATTPNGFPSHYLQDYASNAQIFSAQLQSLIMEGTLSRFPHVKIVLLESGVTWLPSYMWRITKTWKGIRREVPWVKEAPWDIIRERVRLTVQPFDAPDAPEVVSRILDQIGSDEMLLFSTDFPHWQFENNDAIPAAFPPSLRRKICRDNPLSTYARLKEAIHEPSL